MDKKAEHEQIFRDLEKIANLLPTPMYWLDTKGIVLGANNLVFTGLGGLEVRDRIIGKDHNDFYPKDVADTLTENNNKVIQLGQTIEFEEKIVDITTKEIKYATSIRSPIRDSSGNIIGVIGTSIDITAEKKAEELKLANDQLKFENQRLEFESQNQKIAVELDAYKKFKQIADQMAHDLGSPLMAMSVLENSCAELPEEKRNMLRESISRIRDIAGSLLSQYKPLEEETNQVASKKLLVYAALEQILMDKQYEYHNLDIEFKSQYSKNAISSFIEAENASFKRMLSNLINNSVEAIGSESGKITLMLDSDNEEVRISICDSGKGMTESILHRINNKIPFSHGKANGYGIGFSQIHETIEQTNGSISINSTLDVGTIITLTFPRVQSPEWLAEQIHIASNDIIIILDDDSSIHGAWDIRFTDIINNNPEVRIKHFKQANEVMSFIDELSEEEKQHTFLLTDYELLKQSINGLDVIKKVKLKHSLLVTSHYNDAKIQAEAKLLNTRILPKILASNINISVY